VKAQIKVPAVGESITEGTIASWNKKNGDYVKRDEVLFSLETDKASVEVVAEADGVLTQKAKAGEVVKVGAVVGEIDTDAKAGASTSASTPPPQQQSSVSSLASAAAAAGANFGATANGTAKSTPPSAPSVSPSQTMAPSVRRVVQENNLNPDAIAGTGKGGRLTKADALGAVGAGMVAPPIPRPAQAPAGASVSPSASLPAVSPFKTPATNPMREEVVREPMTNIRRRIAERLVQAQHTAAILTTFNEIDMTEVMALRAKYKDKFEKKYGIGLGFMGFFVKAAIEALRAYPRVNAYIEGNDVVYHNYYNVGVAVGTEKGLMVPVLKHVEHMSLAEIEMNIKNYATKAREGKISIDDLNGGTFTISNGGVYGSLMSTPILNPPQSAILGMHKIEERPIAIKGQVVVRPMMYVALSYDHRIIDGGESVSFLVRIKDCIEDPSRLLLEI
jgi:2-oxoglutarate dehydrogenase E2 component (dihydrolipoamide succinyltransferase)